MELTDKLHCGTKAIEAEKQKAIEAESRQRQQTP
jgi:hypothetical protein